MSVKLVPPIDRVPPWKDEVQGGRFMAHPLGYSPRTVRLSAEATRAVWEAYRPQAVGLFVVTWQGGLIRGPLALQELALNIALAEDGAVYSLKSRRGWRPVWWPSTPLEVRTKGNMSYERVRILGWDGLIEGWDKRPKAKLFET